MEDIEIQIFDEINDYKEKIGIMTFRQWIFAALMVVTVVPTYILLPKYTFISKDAASYIVILEAAIIGFIGFVKIHNLPAEKIIPYWYRHYFVFNKPIEYMSTKDYKIQQEEKKDKNKRKAKKMQEIDTEAKKDNTALTKKQLKEVQKQQKALEKARKKYGYKFSNANAGTPTVATNNSNVTENIEVRPEVSSKQKGDTQKTIKEDNPIINGKNDNIEKTASLKDDAVYVKVDAKNEVEKLTKNGAVSPPVVNEKGKNEPFAIDENASVPEKQDEPNVVEANQTEITKETSDEEDLDKKLKSLSDEEKKVLLKLLGK